MARVITLLSLLGTGAVVLFASFTLLAGISPREVAAPASVAVATGAVLFVRSIRIDYEIRSRGGDPQLREARNRMRERRGF